MAYKLKNTALASKFKMLIAVDPDTLAIKDFASPARSAEMVINAAGITIGTETWDGNTRHYWQMANANDIAFGVTKPNIVLDAGTPQITLLAAMVVGGRYALFGHDSSRYFGTNLYNSGSTTSHPVLFHISAFGGGQTYTSGEKRIFGVGLTRGVSSTGGKWFTALHDAAAMTGGEIAPKTNHEFDWTLSYIGRESGSTYQFNKSRTFFLAWVDGELTPTEQAALRDDWRTALLEVDSGGATITISPSTQSVQTGASANMSGNRSSAAPTGGLTYNLTSSNPAVATVPATATMTAGSSTVNFSASALTVGTTTITATNAANSSETATATITVTNTTVRTLRVRTHWDAKGAINVAGVVRTGGPGEVSGEIGRFTGQAFKTALVGGLAELDVPVSLFGGGSLTLSDTPEIAWEATSAADSALGVGVAIGSVGWQDCSVVEV